MSNHVRVRGPAAAPAKSRPSLGTRLGGYKCHRGAGLTRPGSDLFLRRPQSRSDVWPMGVRVLPPRKPPSMEASAESSNPKNAPMAPVLMACAAS